MRLEYATSVAALLLMACGAPQEQTRATEPPPAPAPVGPANASGAESATARVGRVGGTFTLGSGARLEIPSGAITEEVEVTMSVGAEGQAFGDAERQRPLGPMFAVTPRLVAEQGALRVSVPRQTIPSGFSEDDLAFAMEEVDDEQRAIDVLGTQTRWQFYRVTVEGQRFVAEVGGLPGHRLRFGVAR